VASRPVLRIFISSTAIDLTGYRDKVRDAVLRLESLPIAMETFSALGGAPATECMRMAAGADAVICIVAHRYGYVPPVELGGDGERSITWLEVDAAKSAGKPVFAFLVDPKAPWTEVREEGRLVSEPEKTDEIVKAVRQLQELKAYLNRFTRQTFTSAEELAKLVAITLSNFTPEATATTRVWKPLFCHALQPAQNFRGRVAKLQELKGWLQSPVTPDRVISVVAAGGTGKTALVNKALHDAKLSDRAGIFVWSFYEDPRTDACLRAAYTYFTGKEDAPAGGMLERLQLALSGDAPHVMVLDGLERVQSEGDHGRRGELEEMQLRRLVRALAGGVGNARALVTSRFPLVDLESWTGSGHRAIALDDLELPVALDVLRAWGVKGDDAALERSLEQLNIRGFYHALSIAVLGSYLSNFAGGDPSRAPDISLQDGRESDDPKARKLYRVLEQYAEALASVERDLLARLSLFPRGVKVELLGWIVQAGGEVAGDLMGLPNRELLRLLERLKALGLVFRYETDRQIVYSAHPFLREFFRSRLRTNPESVHESVRSRLAPSLAARSSKPPTEPAVLDQYEMLIEQTLLAGRAQEAADLYRLGLNGYHNLGKVLGDNVRGIRILERFFPRDDFAAMEPNLSPTRRGYLVTAFGLFAENVGDLNRARAAFAHSQSLDAATADLRNGSVDAQNLADVELLAGRFPQAFEHSEHALALATKTDDRTFTMYSFVARAASYFILGRISAAVDDFHRATELEGQALYSVRGIWEAECKLLRGDRTGALSQTLANHEIAAGDDLNADLCRCDALLGRLLTLDDPAQAALHLQDAREFANRSGAVDLQLRSFLAACELHGHLDDYPQSIAEGEAGILLADTCGFGKYSIDIRLTLAETYLTAGDAGKALQNARNALDRSELPDCQYAWGKADGLHFCGMAHLRLGERELARQRLTAALEIRERLGHGRVDETRHALDLCRS
jgi:tetratricopeptide (TPR) repeat protein